MKSLSRMLLVLADKQQVILVGGGHLMLDHEIGC
jgi:hypothetical protein